MSEPSPRIAAAAIIYKGKTYSLPKPNRHHHIIWAIHDKTGDIGISGLQGFLTDTGEFVDRHRGKAIAMAAGQITKTLHLELYSEDLW